MPFVNLYLTACEMEMAWLLCTRQFDCRLNVCVSPATSDRLDCWTVGLPDRSLRRQSTIVTSAVARASCCCWLIYSALAGLRSFESAPVGLCCYAHHHRTPPSVIRSLQPVMLVTMVMTMSVTSSIFGCEDLLPSESRGCDRCWLTWVSQALMSWAQVTYFTYFTYSCTASLANSQQAWVIEHKTVIL